MRPPCLIFGQKPSPWRDFVQKFAYGERVPHPHAVVSQARNEDRGPQQQDFGSGVGVGALAGSVGRGAAWAGGGTAATVAGVGAGGGVGTAASGSELATSPP